MEATVRRFAAAMVLAGLLAAEPARAQSTTSDDPVRVDDVTVTGARLRSLVEVFVSEVGAPARDGRGLARWRGDMCVGAVNFRSDVAQYLVDRVSDEARALELAAAEPGCSPNVLIVGTDDSEALMGAWLQKRRRAFFTGIGAMSQSRATLERLSDGQSAVKWWHVSIPIDDDTGMIAIRMPGESPPWIRVRSNGRLRTQITDAMMRVVIVVDVQKVGAASLEQLADYVTFVALAQVDPDSETSRYETILNLFNSPQPDLRMSAWDRSYLAALYGLQTGYRGRGHQAGAMARIMERDQRRMRASESLSR